MNFDDYKGKDITNPDMESVNEIADQYSESDIKNLKNRVTADKVEDKVLKVKFKKESADETRYHLVLEDKILKLLTFLEFNMFTHVKNEYKKTYVNIIRDSLIDMYRNAAAYRLSRTISHIYAVDIEKEKLYDLYLNSDMSYSFNFGLEQYLGNYHNTIMRDKIYPEDI